MSVPDKVSYFSRLTTKFLEILAASIATAVGGYLVAHLGGYLPFGRRGSRRRHRPPSRAPRA